MQHLLRLGVKSPDLGWLESELRQLHSTGRLHDADHGHLWHEDLTNAILSTFKDLEQRRVREALKNVPLIPMQDGSWRCESGCDSDAIFFPTTQDVSVPNDVEIPMVFPEAATSQGRKKLFRLLGVKYCGLKDIVGRIRLFHRTFKSASVENLVSHVRYLYDVRELIELGYLGDDIWFGVDRGDSLCRGPKIYFAESSPSSSVPPTSQLRSVFEDYTGAKYLHQYYSDEFIREERGNFIGWLKECFGIESIPRLCHYESLHPDFRWLLDRQQRALEVLSTHWAQYKKTMTPGTEKEIRQFKFLCVAPDYSEYIELQEAFAASKELTEICRTITGSVNCAFLSLPSNDFNEWRFLSAFNVGFHESLRFYLWLLRQKGFLDQRSREMARTIYTKLERHSGADDTVIR
jgi:hypothetical protein